jgi:hypothetical protein
MKLDQTFIDSVRAEAPHLLQAAGEITAYENLFDEIEVCYDDDGEACVSVWSVMPYPGLAATDTHAEDGWSAAVYGEEAEVWHLGKIPAGSVFIVDRERMPLSEFLDILAQADWELGCRIGIFNTGREVS